MDFAAVIEEGVVFAGASVAIAVIFESSCAARKDEPPPIECPITADVFATAPKNVEEDANPSAFIAPTRKARSFPKSRCTGEKLRLF